MKTDVAHLARLARLDLTPDEIDRMGVQLEQILAYVRCLERVDVEGVEPTSFAGGGARVRPPGLRLNLAPGEATESAPDAAGETFRVPRVVG